jgi:hypothetical protein
MKAKILVPLLMLLTVSPAHAVLVTVDANDYAPGTDISHAGAGATISNYTNATGPSSSDVGPARFDPLTTGYLYPGAPAFAGRFLSFSEGYGCLTGTWSGGCNEQFSLLHVGFDTLTDFVEIRAYKPQEDPVYFKAFAADGSILAACYLPPTSFNQNAVPVVQSTSSIHGAVSSTPCGEAVGEDYFAARISLSSPSIAYVMFGGIASNWGAGFLQSISYETNETSVPEPSTLALMSAGFAGLFFSRRRRLG